MKRRLTGKRLLLAIIAGVMLLLLGVCLLRWQALTHALDSQRAAERWAGDSDLTYSQVSGFLPVGATFSETERYAFYDALERELQAAGLQQPESGALYTDAWSGLGELSVSGSHGKATAQTVAVGGNFFFFHPLQLRCGNYLSTADIPHDLALLDENLAFQLFGALDVAGETVTIDGAPYRVAGVVKTGDDPFTERIRGVAPLLFVYADRFPQIAPSCYELVCVEPLRGFTAGVVRKSFPLHDGQLVENSRRWQPATLDDQIWQLGSRAVSSDGVAYPWWENAARIVDAHLALLLVVIFLLALFPAFCGVWLLIRLGRRGKQAWRVWRAERD